MNRHAWISATALVALAGCTAPLPQELAGTEWVLIDLKPASSATPQDVPLGKYRMRLDRSGGVSLDLDCNRATTTWTAKSLRPGSGRISFGNVAATLALCADGGVGEVLAHNLAKVSSYELYDGRLTLSTASGAAYTFDSVA